MKDMTPKQQLQHAQTALTTAAVGLDELYTRDTTYPDTLLTLIQNPRYEPLVGQYLDDIARPRGDYLRALEEQIQIANRDIQEINKQIERA